MKWNEAQERAIFTRDKNILVSAAAGSGKTAVLTERIRQLVVQEGVSLDEMLIMTFTNAAAAELRERTHQSLTEAMEEEGADLRILQEQLDLLPGADICTFHSFCLKVIRSYFYLTDVTPDFRICDETQEEIYEQEAMDRMMTESFEKKDSEILEFLRKYADSRGEDRVRKMVHAIHRFLKSLPEPEEWLEKSLTAIRESKNEQERETLPALLVLTEMVRRYDRFLREKKQSVNQLSFSDVEHIALQILRQEGPAEELREQYRCIFIDEYQDTSDLQETLVRLIRREDNVFMVGDVKQSIYQFRQADPSIFIEKYRSLREGSDPKGIKIDLNRNFRSKPNILDFVNEVMEPVMTEEAGGIVYDAAAKLYPGFDYAATPAADYPSLPVEIDVIEEKTVRERMIREGWTVSELKREELEAMQACRRIREVLGREYYDNKAKEVRRVSLSDIVVLMRSYRGAAQTWQEVFRRESIPAYVEGNDDYFETVEILVFTNLLKILVNRRQDIPLLSVLRSPIFGYTASELAAVRIHRKEGLFAESFLSYAEEGEEDALREKCRNTLERLDRWGEEAGYLSLKDLCWKAADESGYYEFAGALPRGSRRQENIRDLISRADKYQKDTGGNLAGFLKYIDRLAKTSAEVPARKPSGAGEEYVRLMSIHKSKGLEFPVVFVAGLSKEFNTMDTKGDLIVDMDFGVGVKCINSELRVKYDTLKRQLIADSMKLDSLGEEIRVLYVALTRAKEKLILTAGVKDLQATMTKQMISLMQIGESKGPLPYSMRSGAASFFLLILPSLMLHPSMRAVLEKYELDTALFDKYADEKSLVPGLKICILGEADLKSAMIEEQVGLIVRKDELKSAILDMDVDEELLKGMKERFSARYGHESLKGLFTKTTVSELKMAHMIEEGEVFGDSAGFVKEAEADAQAETGMGVAADAGDGADSGVAGEGDLSDKDGNGSAGGRIRLSGAERGTAYHRIMELLDENIYGDEKLMNEAGRLGEALVKSHVSNRVFAFMNQLSAVGMIPSEYPDNVWGPDIASFLGSDLGQRMGRAFRRGQLMREKPFMMGVSARELNEKFPEEEMVLIQGIIDAWFIEDGEIVLLDYKTDRVDTEKELIDRYKLQLDLYKRALEAAVGMKVKEVYIYAFRLHKVIAL